MKDNISMEQKCGVCHEKYCIEVPNVCGLCFTKKAVEYYKEQRDFKKTFFSEFKEFTYHCMFYCIPLWIIAMCFGMETELIALGFQIWCMLALQPLIKFCMRIF